MNWVKEYRELQKKVDIATKKYYKARDKLKEFKELKEIEHKFYTFRNKHNI